MRSIGVQFKINHDDFIGNFPSHVESFFKHTDPGDFIIFPEDIGFLVAFKGITSQTSIEAIQVLYSNNQKEIDSIATENELQNFTSAIFLSLTSRFIVDFYDLFSSLSKKYSVYTLTCNNMSRFLRKGEKVVFSEPAVYNTAFVFDPSGELIFKQDKVFLTQTELDLGISGGDVSRVSTFELEGRKFGIAISLDAFVPEYISRLTDAEVIIQPDANPGKWNSYLSNGRWQPEEWMDSAYYLAQRMQRVKYVVNPMMVGNLYEMRFEGQSAIMKKAEERDSRMGYIGNAPSTGFHSLIGIPGYDRFNHLKREDVVNKSLEYDEGMIELEL
ncbi:MAG: carbon-nitrogen hydrolase family protein [Thermoplasmatales archaeon]|nr:carbon-nitrogen hydrolase family protein [Candidatus Thermoplasmatota archaeon]MDA8056256.1 carbon-nitrogen hydrolase family protein [Thermoplasmatales archaeon]